MGALDAMHIASLLKDAREEARLKSGSRCGEIGPTVPRLSGW